MNVCCVCQQRDNEMALRGLDRWIMRDGREDLIRLLTRHQTRNKRGGLCDVCGVTTKMSRRSWTAFMTTLIGKRRRPSVMKMIVKQREGKEKKIGVSSSMLLFVCVQRKRQNKSIALPLNEMLHYVIYAILTNHISRQYRCA